MPEQLMDKPEKRAFEPLQHRARRTWRTRFAADYRHWVRRTFSRESYISSLKALLWVVPLSALIWSYAFNEQLELTPPITVNLALSQDADRVVRFVDDRRSAIVKLKGPQKDLGTIEDYLRANTLKLDVDRGLGPGRHQIDVQYALNHDRRVTAAGMTVESCEPDQVTVDIDTIVSRTVEVKLRPEEPSTMHATFTPAQVKLLGPKQQLDAAVPQFVYASPKSYAPYLKPQAGIYQAGVYSVPAVSLEIPPGLDATTTPGTVHAEIEVSSTEVTDDLPPVSIMMAVPIGRGLFDSYNVEYDARQSGFKIAGPKAAVESAKQGTPVAVFQPSFDKPGIPQTAKLDFLPLPSGVRIVGDKPQTIDYTVRPR